MQHIELTNSEIIRRIDEHIPSERDRRIMRLRYVDGLTYERIAEMEQISITVMALINISLK
jgi:DNA-directed RNA polymerase specialized sigma24 family protein